MDILVLAHTSSAGYYWMFGNRRPVPTVPFDRTAARKERRWILNLTKRRALTRAIVWPTAGTPCGA